MNEVYDDVGDEYDNDEDEDCVDIDAVEARPDLGVMRDDVDYDDVDSHDENHNDVDENKYCDDVN